MHPFVGSLHVSFVAALHRMVLHLRPKIVIEVGLMRAGSALGILSALAKIGSGQLISLNPMQSTDGHNIGRHAIDRAGLSGYHRLIEEFDYLALPQLLAQGVRAQMVYIGGWHTADYKILDAFDIDKMLDVGGVMAWNDCHFEATKRAINLMLTHRRYEEIDSGLRPDYTSRWPGGALAKRLIGHNQTDRYFKKTEQWEPNWDFYATF